MPDVASLRARFPALDRIHAGFKAAYFDGPGGTQVPQDVVDSLKSNRLDIIETINLKASGHDIPLSATGDVLRVDLGLDSRFPNGRPIPYGAAPNKEQADVTDVLLSVILAKGTLTVSDGAQANDKPYLAAFPYLALPHEGFSGGHGMPTAQ